MIYPFAANYIFENRADSIVTTIEKASQDTGSIKWADALRKAEQYNCVVSEGHIQLKDPFLEEEMDHAAGDYDSLLCMTEDGVMGFVEIPSIDLSLPIYHGTSEQILETGAGHLQGTSLPVGGESTHAVLTGHSGLCSAKLFTDLTEMEKGDVFSLNVMGKKLAYRVDQIKVVLPNELEDLYVEKGKDYCTLITCTPYGVNTHRLLVRGERTAYQETTKNPGTVSSKKIKSRWMAEYKRALAVSLVMLSVGIILLITTRYIAGRSKIMAGRGQASNEMQYKKR